MGNQSIDDDIRFETCLITPQSGTVEIWVAIAAASKPFYKLDPRGQNHIRVMPGLTAGGKCEGRDRLETLI